MLSDGIGKENVTQEVEIIFEEEDGLLSQAAKQENNTGFTEISISQESEASDDSFSVSTEINSEFFIRPQHNPAMDAYLKKPVQKPSAKPKKKNKRKKGSFFRRVREKITLYLRKLTLSDIRLIDED